MYETVNDTKKRSIVLCRLHGTVYKTIRLWESDIRNQNKV